MCPKPLKIFFSFLNSFDSPTFIEPAMLKEPVKKRPLKCYLY